MSLCSQWPLPGFADLRDELLAAYSAPGRGYHDLRHLREVLARLEELAENHHFDQRAVRLAAWFHDSVYSGEADDEARSAEWASTSLTGLGLSHELVNEVARLVRLTANHRPVTNDLNGCALSDADLAILASDPERYAQYTADVRREYAHISNELFCQGRSSILRSLLDKPTVFHTTYAIDAWEITARTNLTNELAQLNLPTTR